MLNRWNFLKTGFCEGINNEYVATPRVDDPLSEGEPVPLILDGEEAVCLVTKIEPRTEMVGNTFVVGTVWVRRVA